MQEKFNLLDQNIRDLNHDMYDKQSIGLKELHVRIYVPTSIEASTPVHLLMKYMCSPATWSPHYEVRVRSKAAGSNCADSQSCKGDDISKVTPKYNLEIDYFANVIQQTGHDWTEVKLSLSTASPVSLNELPIPQSKLFMMHASYQ